MRSLRPLFESNRSWADEVKARDPAFFQTLVGQQSPDYLWIGCADSRVPANEIVGLLPGELFVHLTQSGEDGGQAPISHDQDGAFVRSAGI